MNGTSSDATAIAIVGIGCQFPRAPDKQAFWANVRDGVDAIGEIPPTHFAVDDYFDPDPKAPDRIYVRRGGFLEPVAFDALRWGIAPRDLEATDTTQLLGLMVAQAALDDADYGPGRRPLPHERTSVILGVTGALELVIPLGARLGHPLWRRALRDAGVDDATAPEPLLGEPRIPTPPVPETDVGPVTVNPSPETRAREYDENFGSEPSGLADLLTNLLGGGS